MIFRLVVSAAVVSVMFAVVPSATGDAAQQVVVTHKVKDGRKKCSDVSTKRLPVDGGCVIRATAEHIAFRVYTPLGSFSLGRDCRMYVAAHLEGNGRIWFESIEVAGDNPCPDVRPCEYGTGYESPWPTRVRFAGDGHASLRVNVCLDTCVGWFEAPVVLPLELVDGVPRAIRFDGLDIGDTGLEIDGRLVFERSDVLVEER